MIRGRSSGWVDRPPVRGHDRRARCRRRSADQAAESGWSVHQVTSPARPGADG
ncbi:glycosyl transferase, group 2 family domain protein [Mycobacterium xenopi 4042]|uniref:Glycosyl transferase, group 2 family domain protein n=1 Tax=Mycobacterium xenopi 4042 TaxID=1299334 RepID=X7ZIH4_MYCXE|nr:glycosyl transferase, group 2 family domain protein [Mycobacterium xenopi 4042]EUA24782.1 glycosyl transferase, group 2 family domain protein [Mycobacterium xenopi 3993]